MNDMTDMSREMYNTFQSACSNCPADGDWSPWTPWESCSVTCGQGMRRRSRQCDDPAPRGGGKWCVGPAVSDEPCSGPDCCSDGNWSPWLSWSGCSATCGPGMRERRRTCSNPSPNHCGRICPGPDSDMQNCDSRIPCCSDGNWNSWTPWGQCSVTCGTGTVQRSRTCSNPPPNYCGSTCPGPPNDARPCDTMRDCCVNGNWGGWQRWSGCSATCELGTRERRRRCDSPPANFCGRQCPGSEAQSEGCNSQVSCSPPCVDGNWGSWQSWSSCSATCGTGAQSRMRRCDNPSPNFCGQRCPGTASDQRQCNSGVPCCVPRDGNWGFWTPWSLCSATCGPGMRDRSRTCSNPPANQCGRNCPGPSRDTDRCQGDRCCVPRDGNWAMWSRWTSCSVTCGTGSRRRSRTCSNPPANECGRDCPGREGDTDRCDQGPCCVNGNWGSWERWSRMSVTCGSGMRNRRRRCDNPSANFCGQPCPGSPMESERSDTGVPCPPACVNGNWGSWERWSRMSVTCGSGMRNRRRRCDNPSANFCGQPCPGSPMESERSDTGVPCPPACVNGNWGSWERWSRMSVTCGSGMRDRRRRCDNPSPNFCGQSCPGSPMESERSETGVPCPPACVNGNWGSWERWSRMSVTCGSGMRDRRRRCDNPSPNFCGQSCPGSPTESERSETGVPCPPACVNGNWGSWERWSRVSVTCGSGMRDRRRRCDNPSANFCGQSCPGRDLQREEFDTRVTCPPACVNGNWGSWERWSRLSVTCGSAMRDRRRRCDNPSPNFCGQSCPGRDLQRDELNTGVPCQPVCVPRDGNWSPWTPWSQCSATCGSGSRERSRSCSNPPANQCGRDCPGQSRDTERCQGQQCCVNGNWGTWERWSQPSASCGSATRDRRRRCDNPSANFCGRSCPGSDLQTEPYETGVPCCVPRDGNWSPWSRWSQCSVTCGGGTRDRSRACSDPSPNRCGRPCTGPAQDTGRCNEESCCVNGNWGSWERWSRLSVTCGSGMRDRRRRCDNPSPNFCGQSCPGSDRDSELSDTGVACRVCVSGNWGSWERWNQPSVTCGIGTRDRRRRCDNPPANFCGRSCPGSAMQTEPYDNGVPCVTCVDGNWGRWASWGSCLVTCGMGMRERRRECDSPPNNYCGQPCPGSSSERDFQRCGPDRVEGQWASWETWEGCSATCDRGQQLRRRICPSGLSGACVSPCPGPETDARPCDLGPCQRCVERQWSPWGSWSACDATCDFGQRTRSRSCQPVSYGQDCGNRCPGASSDVDSCPNLPSCPPTLQPWGGWSPCSATCAGFGVRERVRLVSTVVGGGLSGRQVEQGSCEVTTPPCAPEASWSVWEDWCPCGCKKGKRSRRRLCETRDVFGLTSPVDISLCGNLPAREEEYCDVRLACPTCVSECRGRQDGDYPSCTSCNDYITCTNGRQAIFTCTARSYEWDAFIRKCVPPPSPSCSLVACISSCTGVADGRFPSCFGCASYVECRGGRDQETRCPDNQEFNAHSQQCDVGKSPTCVRPIRRSIDFQRDAPDESYFPADDMKEEDKMALYKQLMEKAGVASKFNRSDDVTLFEKKDGLEATNTTSVVDKEKSEAKPLARQEDKEENEVLKPVPKDEKKKKNSFKCETDCSKVEAGFYQSCKGCPFYIICTKHGVARRRKCIHNKVWDDKKKKCRKHSRTCKTHKRQNGTSP
ncbi:hypothetical protein V1264_017467 [Littorina saxatilis]|uniref:Chitin-binding type-2 domain-containing protein n=2 Tax=Littorina saxatilis TaxID=31220 RepID=A0AAN9BH84_9CAEN